MKWGVLGAVLFAGFFPLAVFAQQSSAKPALTDPQKDGRRVFQQKCAMCHVPASASAKTLGPPLSKGLVDGNEDAIRDVISNGQSNLMPGFKYILTPTQIADVMEFVKTLDAPVRTLSTERPER